VKAVRAEITVEIKDYPEIDRNPIKKITAEKALFAYFSRKIHF
jgi:hypothetical protein